MGWFSSALLLSLCVTSTYGEITCDVRDVVAGESTNITCHFDEDVRQSNKNIKVLRQPQGSNGFDPDKTVTVLDCHWSTVEDMQCDPADGYILHGIVSNTAILGIQKASREQVGKYTCEAIPTEPSNIKSCTFMLKALTDEAVATILESLKETHEGLAQLSDRVDQYQATQTTISIPATVAAAFAVLTFIAVVIGIVLLLGRKRLSVCLEKHLPTTGQTQPEESNAADATDEPQPTEEYPLLEKSTPAGNPPLSEHVPAATPAEGAAPKNDERTGKPKQEQGTPSDMAKGKDSSQVTPPEREKQPAAAGYSSAEISGAEKSNEDGDHGGKATLQPSEHETTPDSKQTVPKKWWQFGKKGNKGVTNNESPA